MCSENSSALNFQACNTKIKEISAEDGMRDENSIAYFFFSLFFPENNSLVTVDEAHWIES